MIEAHPGRFKAEVLTANTQTGELIAQARKFRPAAVVIGNEFLYDEVFEALNPLGIEVYAGEQALKGVVEIDRIDIVLTATVGFSGLVPTLSAIRKGKTIALANKETMVVAGALVTKEAAAHRVRILPVDSEHSAIFQCLEGEPDAVEKLILTASGGPFRGKTVSSLREVTVREALNHPNWSMGDKISIDSATMMNKGLEVIEAHWLFGVDAKDIEVVVHPQSIIHSMVQFDDGSIKAQMGLPDMRLPIQYAFTYPERLKSGFPRFDFYNAPALTFERPDTDTFRSLALAYEVLDMGGNMPCVLNAANEMAVDAFLKSRIRFMDIAHTIEWCLANLAYIRDPVLDDLIETDKETRIKVLEHID